MLVLQGQWPDSADLHPQWPPSLLLSHSECRRLHVPSGKAETALLARARAPSLTIPKPAADVHATKGSAHDGICICPTAPRAPKAWCSNDDAFIFRG